MKVTNAGVNALHQAGLSGPLTQHNPCANEADPGAHQQEKNEEEPALKRVLPMIRWLKSATFEDDEAGTLALRIGVVTDQTHVVVGVGAVAGLEFTDDHA